MPDERFSSLACCRKKDEFWFQLDRREVYRWWYRGEEPPIPKVNHDIDVDIDDDNELEVRQGHWISGVSTPMSIIPTKSDDL